MKMDISQELAKDSFRENLNCFTRQAWSFLPPLERPAILDLGCGSGVPTVTLALVSDGMITAVDHDVKLLAVLKQKIFAFGLRHKIKIKKGDIGRLRFKKEFFDIIWCEGATGRLGFEGALRAWRSLVRPQGYVVIHDEAQESEQKIRALDGLGYHLVRHFSVTADIWLRDYFKPLAERIELLKKKYLANPDILAQLRRDEEEIAAFKADPHNFVSAFFIMQRR